MKSSYININTFNYMYLKMSSKLSLILFNISAQSATQRILFSIRRVRNFEWTLGRTWTFGKLVLWFPRDIITSTLSFMTIIAKMRSSPTKPLRNTTTKFTLKFNVICSVLFATFLST